MVDADNLAGGWGGEHGEPSAAPQPESLLSPAKSPHWALFGGLLGVALLGLKGLLSECAVFKVLFTFPSRGGPSAGSPGRLPRAALGVQLAVESAVALCCPAPQSVQPIPGHFALFS